jgi:hypothetical protein
MIGKLSTQQVEASCGIAAGLQDIAATREDPVKAITEHRESRVPEPSRIVTGGLRVVL